MAEADSAVTDHFNGNMVFVNAMVNMSVDCDCCAIAEDPCLKDIGYPSSNIIYHLDSANLSRFTDHEISEIYRP